MSVISSSILAGASGSAGGDKVYVDDVFSTAVYTGNASSNTVPSGLDFTEGSWLSWIKLRDGSDSHFMSDSTQKTGVCFDSFASDRTYGKQTGETTGINAVGTSSYSIQGGNAQVNGNTKKYTSWNFKAQKGFFDVVTWSGNGDSDVAISHSLGSEPGMVIVKRTNATGNWFTYHRSLASPLTKWVSLNQNSAETQANPGVNMWGSMTSTHIGIRDYFGLNTTGGTYVAYIFAHDDAQFGTDEDESIIHCGSFVGSASPFSVDIGFEPSWILFKNSSSSNRNWMLFDAMRDKALFPNNAGSESSAITSNVLFEPRGFRLLQQSDHNVAGDTTIFMAIRRPNKPPETATDVFAVALGNGSGTQPCFTSGFPVDFAFRLGNYEGGGNDPRGLTRLQGSKQLYTPSAAAEASSHDTLWDFMSGFEKDFTNTSIAWMFKRAPGFMDVVAYSGNSSNQNINHNLEVAPEFYIVKRRSGSEDWATYSATLGANKYTKLNTSASTYTNTTIWNNTSPTNSVFTVGNDVSVNGSGDTYIAYLFATLPGISKVGSYSGTGNAINVDCGFTNGARFVLIKRTDSAGSGRWMLFDSLRGIVSGNDPAIELNTTNAQVTGTDYIDPLSTGFTVAASAPATVNASGGTYLFLAIA